MKSSLAMLTLAWMLDGPGLPGRPMAEVVRLSLSTEQARYHVKEPVDLTVAFQNVSEATIMGEFHTICGRGMADCKLKIYYRRNGGTAMRYSSDHERPRSGMPDAWVPPHRLTPGETKSGTRTIAFNVLTGGFVLDEPGFYEFKAVHWDGDMHRKLESNVVAVEVEPALLEEQGALELYGREVIGRFVQDDLRSDNEAEKLASLLVEKYPDSRYAHHVRRQLRDLLGRKVRTRKATPEQQRLFERLDEDRAGARPSP